MSESKQQIKRESEARSLPREKSSVVLKRRFAETSFASEHVQFSWKIKDWRLCRKLLESKRLTSPIFESPKCKWALELIETTKTHNMDSGEQVFKVLLHLEESSENSFVINGSLNIAGIVGCSVNNIISLKKLDNSQYSQQPATQSAYVQHLGSQYNPKSERSIQMISDVPIVEITEENLLVFADFKYSSGNAVTKISKSDATESASWNKALDDLRHQRDVLCEAIGTLLSDSKGGDMTVVVRGTRFPAHKAIMAARSQVFKAMIDEADSKGMAQEFEIECTSINAWKIFQRYIYTAATAVKPEDLLCLGDALFLLQDKFDVVSLSEHLISRFMSMLNCQTVLDVLELAFKHNATLLIAAGTQALTKYLRELKRDKGSQLVSFVQRHAEIAEIVLNHND